jgi:hypothetical protein
MGNTEMLFPDLSADHAHMTSDLPQAMRVSMSGEEESLRSMLTPPDSPVFAELTTPNNQPKGPMFQDGAVPHLKYEPDTYNIMNTGEWENPWRPVQRKILFAEVTSIY